MQTHFQHGPQIVERFMSRGPSGAVYPSLWDSSLVLATLAQPWGGTQARDFSGRHNHGTLTGEPTWGYGAYRGGAFRQLNFPVLSELLLSRTIGFNPNGTVAFWLRRGATGNIIVASGSAYSNGYWFYVSGSDVIQNWGGSHVTYSGHESRYVVGEWNHVTLVKRGDINEIYRNGILEGSDSESTSAGALGSIGRLYTGGTTAYTKSDIADFRCYSRALSTPEISQLALHPLAAYETRINRYWMFTSGGATAPAPEWVAIPRYGLAAAGLPYYALPRAGTGPAPVTTRNIILGGGVI